MRCLEWNCSEWILMIYNVIVFNECNRKERVMKAVIPDKWILCPECGAKTRTQILEETELKHFPLFCPKCKKNFIIDVRNRIVDYKIDPRR